MATPQSSSQTLPNVMHKNHLQEYAQRSGFQLPTYQTINEGFHHAPKFRSTVVVNEVKYTSMSTFPSLKAAEQDVAKLALDRIKQATENEGCPLTYQDSTFCKSILYEFAVKMNLDRPKFTTKPAKGARPVFVSSMVFDGRTYTGDAVGSKKMAEQLAARKAIESLCESNSRILLNQIIKSKDKRRAASRTMGEYKRENSATTAQQEGSSRQLNIIVTSDDRANVHPSCGEKRRLELENLENKKPRRNGK